MGKVTFDCPEDLLSDFREFALRKHSFKHGSLKAELVAAMRAHMDTENKKFGKIKTSGMDELVAEMQAQPKKPSSEE